MAIHSISSYRRSILRNRGGRMNNTYNYNSLRAKEARLGKVFEHWFIRTLMKITVVALLAAAVYLRFALHTSLWWLLLGLAVLLAMFLAWHKYELLRPATGKADDINNILYQETNKTKKRIKDEVTKKDCKSGDSHRKTISYV